MRMPSPTWKAVYKADRRKRRHRCRHCSRIIQPGDAVVIARVQGRSLIEAIAAGLRASSEFAEPLAG